MAYEHAKWKNQPVLKADNAIFYPPPGMCGIRSTEHLSYQNFKSLGQHHDGGSYYTIVFSLSDPKRYSGGEFFIRDEHEIDTHYYFKPRQYSAIVFLSETEHGITDITDGHREAFATEYWQFDDSPWGTTRPEVAEMQVFMDRTKHVDDFSNVDIRSFWPNDEGDSIKETADYYTNSYGESQNEQCEAEEGNELAPGMEVKVWYSYDGIIQHRNSDCTYTVKFGDNDYFDSVNANDIAIIK